jgi:hypothetical protein
MPFATVLARPKTKQTAAPESEAEAEAGSVALVKHDGVDAAEMGNLGH